MATYTLRPYQKQAVDTAVAFFRSNATDNAIEILPTGAGKSLVIANIALGVGEPILVFQPSKEILEQNYAKYASYGLVDCGIYSASFNRKEIAKVTFCTIGSVIRHLDDLKAFKYAIIDECHGVNADGGMYETMIKYLKLKVIGLTATPYRLTPYWEGGSIIKFLTRTRPCIFSKVIHVTQVKELCNAGFLAPLRYFDVQHQYQFDLSRVRLNSTGRDYDEDSLKAEYERCNFQNIIEDVIRRLMGKGKRTRILVFTKFVDEAAALAAKMPHAAFVCGETPKDEREKILADFKSGKIQCVANVGVLTCLSTDTEILTQRGWATVKDISESDMVAQYENEKISFANPIRIIKKEHSGDFVSIEGRYMNIRVTDDHNIIYKKMAQNGLGKERKAKAAELVGMNHIYIPISGECEPEKISVDQPKTVNVTKSRFIIYNAYNYRKKGMTPEHARQRALELYNSRLTQRYKNPDELTLRECEFIGFWLGDGCCFLDKYNHARYSVTQSLANPKMCEWLENLMTEIGIHFTYKEYQGGKRIICGTKCNVSGHRTYSLALGTGGDKQNVKTSLYSLIPYLKKGGSQYYWGLNQEQIMALYKGLVMANGKTWKQHPKI